jgi:cyclopropane-fatty-acyl-phospholipid synthase
MTNDIARRIGLKLLTRISGGQLTVLEGEKRFVFGSGAPQATVHINDRAVWTAMITKGGRGLGASYRDGLWDSPDLAAVFRVAARNVQGIDEIRRRLTFAREPYQRARSAFRSNTPERSREDIAAHYDLGNDLFERMLDPTMMYSCGLFESRDSTLEEASIAKLELVCQKLDITEADHVVEIGTGWGGFAVYAASTRGCRVTTTTISKEQHDVAVARVRAARLEDRVTVLLDDYRDLHGQYDKLVSLEMIEAVGWKDFGTFFQQCSDLLAPDGAMLLQAITMDDRAFEVEKNSKSFIRTFVFPNGCLPSQQVIAECLATRTDMRTAHLEELTPHYAETLRRWRTNVDEHAEELDALGYDERFRRVWHMYLCYCEAGFAEHRIGLVQAVLAKPRWRGVARPLETAGAGTMSAAAG